MIWFVVFEDDFFVFCVHKILYDFLNLNMTWPWHWPFLKRHVRHVGFGMPKHEAPHLKTSASHIIDLQGKVSSSTWKASVSMFFMTSTHWCNVAVCAFKMMISAQFSRLKRLAKEKIAQCGKKSGPFTDRNLKTSTGPCSWQSRNRKAALRSPKWKIGGKVNGETTRHNQDQPRVRIQDNYQNIDVLWIMNHEIINYK